MSDDNSLQGVLYSCPQSQLFPFFLFEDKKIVLTEERIQISRHPLCCPTCGEMSQRENLPSSAHSALPLLLLILLSADCWRGIWRNNQNIKFPSLTVPASAGERWLKYWTMKIIRCGEIILKDESQNSLFARAPPSQATCISDAMKILNKNELKILINSHSHSHVAKHK